MSEFNNYGRLGWYRDINNLISFQIGDGSPTSTTLPNGAIDIDQFDPIHPVILNVNGKYVLIKGTNNRLPEEIASVIGRNRILPELIEKQTRILYGKGPKVYVEKFVNGKLIREWQKQDVIESWMDSWHEQGLQDNIKDYCEKVIRDYYYYEDFFIKWRFTRAARINGNMPVAGLEHVDNKRSRLATEKNIAQIGMDYEDVDFNYAIIGNWFSSSEKFFKVYPRFRASNPFQNGTSVSYHKNCTVGQIYGYNRFYAGIKDWLVGTNRNPKYINSYLENSLNAKVHVIIPWQYVEMIEKKLQSLCDENSKRQDANADLIKPNGIEIGTEYKTSLRDAYISAELEKLSTYLSGTSNQGKMYASFSYETAEGKEATWQIVPLDLKYREFISSLIDYDKRADEVITTAIGIDAAISNISKDGVISKSGSDLYYNYIIYLYNLPLAEETCTEALNFAIKLNFPSLYADGFRVGFYNEVPSRQEDVSPQDRMQNSYNRQNAEIVNILKKQNEQISKLEKILQK